MSNSDMTGEKFKQIRLSLGLSQAQLAAYLGVNTRTVGRWELGRTRVPHSAVLALLALVLRKKSI